VRRKLRTEGVFPKYKIRGKEQKVAAGKAGGKEERLRPEFLWRLELVWLARSQVEDIGVE